MAEVMSQEQSWSEALCPQKFSSALSFILRTRTGIQEFADLCVQMRNKALITEVKYNIFRINSN